MKKLLFTTILFLSTLFANSQCVYQVCLTDAFGDGWTGNTIDVFVNGMLVGNYGGTFTAGFGPECFAINVNNGDDIDIIFNSTGIFPGDCSFQLTDPLNNIVGNGNSFTDIFNVIAVCPCGPTTVSPDPIATINCDGGIDTINFNPAGSCPGGFEYQVLDGATVVQAWSTTASYIASPVTSTTYTVEARCNTCPATVVSDTFRIDIISIPTITGVLTLCQGDSTSLTANGTGDYEWWDSQIGGTLLDTSNIYNTPPLTDTTTYWAQTAGVTSAAGKILITECGLEGFVGDPSADYLEISNLYATPVNTAGWVAAVSASYTNINTVNNILWTLPNSFNACSVVSRNDILGDPNYWGNNIFWNATSQSWAIIIDDLGNVIDFVAWGWSAADIATFNPTINGFNITLGPEWTGNGTPLPCQTTAGVPFSIQRIGNNDGNTLADFVCQASTVDVVNPGLTCGWTPVSCRYPVTVIVNETPVATVPVNAIYCDGDAVPIGTFTSLPVGATYTWTNSDPSIGLAASGTGNAPAFTATNPTAFSVTATITVTPTIGTCVGLPVTYTITVNPEPTATVPLNAVYCDGDAVPIGVFTSNPIGATYTWTNSDPSIGLAASGVGNAPAFTATNATGTPIITTITVIPTLGCVGLPVVYTITVNPMPTVTVPINATYCAGDAAPIATFTSAPAGATFAWTNSDPSIGLAVSGVGNAPAFIATNTTGLPIIATITVTPTLNGCVGLPVAYTITVNPIPPAPTVIGATICPNNSTTLTATAPGGTYEWYDAAVGGTLLFTGASYTTPVLVASTSYWVQSTINGCTGPRTLVTVTIAASIAVNAGLDATICDGQPYNLLVTPNGAGYTYVWDEPANLGFSAIFNPIVSPTVTTTYTVTVTDPTNCTGTDMVTITVNPVPTVTVPANATYCDGDGILAGVFTSLPVGATFAWTNSDPTIGLAASGAGNAPAFTATNVSAGPITGTITVTPTLNGCVGLPVMYTITVNPVPTVTVPANTTYCDGDGILAGVFTSLPVGATFAWTNSDPTIGLAASGAGNAPAFTATNVSAGPITATITVTPTLNGCVGIPVMYTITVNPVPTVTVPASATYCAGDAILAGAFTSMPIGATFAWTNSDPTIGLAGSGAGNAPAFTAANATGAPIIATISVTPTLNGCVGLSVNYTIIVNPIPAAPTALDITTCPNSTVTFNTTAPGGTYEWYDAAVAGTLLFTGANYTTPILVANTSYWVQTTINGCVSPRTMVTATIAAAIVVDAGLDATICNGQPYGLSVTPNGAGYSYVWDEPANLGFASIFNPLVNPTATTTYTVTVTDPSGCIGTDNVIITVDPIPTATVPPNATYCDGILVTASAFTTTPAGGTFDWTNSDPTIGLAASGTGNTPAFSGTNATGGPITATIAVTPTLNGCVGTPVNYSIMINPIPTATVTNNAIYCDGDPVPTSAFGTAPSGGTFSWTNSDPSIGLGGSGLGNAPAFSANNNTGSTLTATIAVTPTLNGCVGAPVNYTVTISAPITLPNVVTNVSCFGDNNGQIEVSPVGGTPNYNYSWSVPGIGNSALATNLPGGSVNVTVTDVNGCTQNLTVMVSEPAQINYVAFSANILTGCTPLTVELYNLTDTSAFTSISWSLGNGAGGGSDTLSTIYTPGSYDIILDIIDTNGCPGSATQTNYITVYDNPIANFSSTPGHATLFDPTIYFNDLSLYNIVAWDWDFAGIGNSVEPGPSFTFPQDTGTYQITLNVQDINGCVATIMQTVEIYTEHGMFIPNSFSPDFDNLNDMFSPKGFGISDTEYSLLIFDRWGEVLFESYQMSKGWDGTYKGKLVPNGTYAWKIIYNDYDGLKHERIGHVSVLR